MLDRRAEQRFGTITSYDDASNTVKVTIEPEGIETGWLELPSLVAGNGWGITHGPFQGQQVSVVFEGGNPDAATITHQIHSSVDVPPSVDGAYAQPGEIWAVGQKGQRVRLMATSHLDDGEFARLLYAKVGKLIGPVLTASLDRAVAAGDASRVGTEPLNLFWFAHHTLLMAALARLPSVPCLAYGDAARLERQLCEFILRGIGLNETAVASHLDRDLSSNPGQPVTAEGA